MKAMWMPMGYSLFAVSWCRSCASAVMVSSYLDFQQTDESPKWKTHFLLAVGGLADRTPIRR